MNTITSNKSKIPTVFKVAGVSFCKDIVENLQEGQVLFLEKDPENKYDQNAIKILNEDKNMVGFVPKQFNLVLLGKFTKITTKYILKVKNVHKWEGPTGLEVEFIKIVLN